MSELTLLRPHTSANDRYVILKTFVGKTTGAIATGVRRGVETATGVLSTLWSTDLAIGADSIGAGSIVGTVTTGGAIKAFLYRVFSRYVNEDTQAYKRFHSPQSL